MNLFLPLSKTVNGKNLISGVNVSDVTRILTAIEQGDAKAVDELLPLVYEELRHLAAQKMSQELPGQTLQATALVHEAYIRLVGAEAQNWSGRTHFWRHGLAEVHAQGG